MIGIPLHLTFQFGQALGVRIGQLGAECSPIKGRTAAACLAVPAGLIEDQLQ